MSKIIDTNQDHSDESESESSNRYESEYTNEKLVQGISSNTSDEAMKVLDESNVVQSDKVVNEDVRQGSSFAHFEYQDDYDQGSRTNQVNFENNSNYNDNSRINDQFTNIATHSPSRMSTKEIVASHDASIAAHKQKLEAHKKWLEDQRLHTPNMKNTFASSNVSWTPDEIKEEEEVFSEVEFEENPHDFFRNYKSIKHVNSSFDKEPIESALLRKGKEIREKREQLQLEHFEREKEVYTFSPKISRDPQNYYKPSPKIEDRLLILERSREEKIELERLRSMEQYTFKPELTENSKNMIPRRPDILDISQKWKEIRNQKLKQARQEKTQEELKELREVPQLSERTLKLLRSINYRFPQQSIADYHASKELERAGKIQSLQESQYQEMMREKPEISSLSKKLVKKLDRDGSISDRLYQESFKRNEEREKLTENKEREKHTSLKETKKFSFQPDQASPSGVRDIYQELVRKGKDIDEKRQMQLEILEARERQLHSKSKINPVSAEIAARLPTTSKERLYSPRRKKNPDDFNDELTFRPKINSKSREMVRETEANQSFSSLSPPSTSRGELLHSLDQRKREKIQNLQEYYEQLEVVECTFKPDLKKTKKFVKSFYNFASNESDTNSEVGDVNETDSFYSDTSQFYGLSFQKRCEEWNKKKEKKRQEAQRLARESELKECTFSPKMQTKESSTASRLRSPLASPRGSQLASPRDSQLKSPRRSRSMTSPSRSAVQYGNPSGFDSFVERQRAARQKKQEQAESPTKSPWQNRITTPQPFRLGRERAKPSGVKALQKVLSPPTFKRHVQKTQGSNASEYFLDDDDDENQKPSPIRTEGIPPQGLFSTRSSVQILESIRSADNLFKSSAIPKLLEESTDSVTLEMDENHDNHGNYDNYDNHDNYDNYDNYENPGNDVKSYQSRRNANHYDDDYEDEHTMM